MELSRAERWILSNQFEILAALKPDQVEEYRLLQYVVEHGYEYEYDDLTQHIYREKDMMTSDECREVRDVLDMFLALQRCHDDLPNKDEINAGWTTFSGFDGNNETKQMVYARFIMEKREQYPLRERGDKGNSHTPRLEKYRRMLAEWNQSRDKNNLTKEDIARIVVA